MSEKLPSQYIETEHPTVLPHPPKSEVVIETDSLKQDTEPYKLCKEVEPPKFRETWVASLCFPLELYDKNPDIRDQYKSVGLPRNGMVNVYRFGKSVDGLNPGEKLTIRLDDISKFRCCGGFSRWPFDEDSIESRRNNNFFKKDEFMVIMYTSGGEAATSIDSYEAVIKQLGIENAPSYKDLLADYLVERDGYLDYKSSDFTTQSGKKAFFLMRGTVVGSIEPEESYDLMVCAYNPPLREQPAENPKDASSIVQSDEIK
jgi:hypothetical protein